MATNMNSPVRYPGQTGDEGGSAIPVGPSSRPPLTHRRGCKDRIRTLGAGVVELLHARKQGGNAADPADEGNICSDRRATTHGGPMLAEAEVHTHAREAAGGCNG